MCGLQVDVEDEQVTLIRRDRDDVWSKGYICPKGTTLGHLHHDPDRLRAPMVRDGDRGARCRWDEAFARCEELLARRVERHGIDAVTALHRQPDRPQLLARPLRRRCSSASRACRTIYSAGTVDQWPKNVSCILMYGEHVEDPGARHPAHRLPGLHGRQPAGVAAASLLACPDVLGEIDSIRARGGKVVVDRPAPHGHRRPGRRVGPDRARHRRRVPARDRATCSSPRGSSTSATSPTSCKGVDDVRARRARLPARAVAATCGIPAETIRRIAREIAAAPTAAVYGRIGLCNQEFGTLASWLVDVVNILDRQLRPSRRADVRQPGRVADGWIAADRNAADGVRVRPLEAAACRGVPEVLGQVPVVVHRRGDRDARATGRSRRSSPSRATR